MKLTNEKIKGKREDLDEDNKKIFDKLNNDEEMTIQDPETKQNITMKRDSLEVIKDDNGNVIKFKSYWKKV